MSLFKNLNILKSILEAAFQQNIIWDNFIACSGNTSHQDMNHRDSIQFMVLPRKHGRSPYGRQSVLILTLVAPNAYDSIMTYHRKCFMYKCPNRHAKIHYTNTICIISTICAHFYVTQVSRKIHKSICYLWQFVLFSTWSCGLQSVPNLRIKCS